jgi:hypothetical protein
MKNRLCFLASFFTLIIPMLAGAQNLYQEAPPMPSHFAGQLGMAYVENPIIDWGFFPFSRDTALSNAVRTMCLSMFETSRCESTDALSYIPASSLMYSTLGFSLTQCDFGTANEVTLQKLLNKGGNIALAMSKPLYYYAHRDGPNSFPLSGQGSFLYIIPRLSFFSDIPYLDRVFGGGGGARFDLTADYHILDFLPVRKDRGPYLLTFGVRANVSLNQFINAPNIPSPLQRTAIGIGELYAGLGFFQLTFDFNKDLTHTNIFKGRELLYRVTVVPWHMDL